MCSNSRECWSEFQIAELKIVQGNADLLHCAIMRTRNRLVELPAVKNRCTEPNQQGYNFHGGGGGVPSVVVRLALINQCKFSESFILLVSFHSQIIGLKINHYKYLSIFVIPGGTWMAPDYFTIEFWGKQCFWGNSAEFDFLQTLTSITWKYPNSSSQGPFSILDKTSNWRQLCWWKFEKIIQHFQNTHCHITKFELHSKTK